MYGDVDAVAMLVENLYHLLIAIALGHTNQTSELADTMVYMNHEVANLKLLYLLKRKCHLTTTGLVALEVVFMEAVEDLVVGKNTDAQFVISKALVERFINAGERYICLFGKDILQTLNLLLTVGEDIDLIPLKEIVLKGLSQQVEVLMEEGLHGDIEVKR